MEPELKVVVMHRRQRDLSVSYTHLRQLGLLLFLAEVGTSAGKNLVATFQESGLLLFGVGAAIRCV